MRILPHLPLQEGYEPFPSEFNHEEGLLDIFHPSSCSLIEESKIVPETLVLRCGLRPIPIANKSIQVQLISEGESLKSTPLYAKESIIYGYERDVEASQWQGMALDYLGIGRGVHQGETFTFHGETLPSGKIECEKTLYIKPFSVEAHHHQERQTTLPFQQFLTSPPGILNTRILRGYGGYYKTGIALDEIQQIYYSLAPTHTQTRVRLHSSLRLKESLTPSPIGGKDIIFHPRPKEEEYLSFSGALAAGYVQIAITTEYSQVSFRSFLCESVANTSTYVNVYFKP